MSISVALALGLLLGIAGTHYVHRGELSYLRKELATAQDRLLAAWRDEGAVIPPRPVEPVKVEPLPEQLRAWVNNWESPESKAIEESRIRHLMHQGLGVEAIIAKLEGPG